MKKIFSLLLIAGFVVGFLGCGPKGASKEQLSKLAELKAAAETLEGQLKDLEAERAKLEQEKFEKQQMKSRLQAEYEVLEKENVKEGE